MITVFADLIFGHNVISGTLRGRTMRKNQRVATAGGFESINIVQDKSRREYDFASIQLLREDWDYLETIYEITDAGAYGFLLEDPHDYHSTSTTAHSVSSGVVASLGSGTYQAFKRRQNVASGRYKDRKITRPNATGFELYVNNVLQSSGYSLDANTGIITISSNPAAANVRWAGKFYVPVHFQSDILDWTLEASGPPEARYYSGPSIVLEEIRE